MTVRELPGPTGWRLVRTFASLLRGDLRCFRAGHAENADQTLLGAYRDGRDPDTGEAMSDRQLRDQVVTPYLAGHETAASLLTWAHHRLARRQDIAERVIAEIDAHADDGIPNSDDLKEVEYRARFVNEVLRLYPPAWTIIRDRMCSHRNTASAADHMDQGGPAGLITSLQVMIESPLNWAQARSACASPPTPKA